jgi:hypothetical protein
MLGSGAEKRLMVATRVNNNKLVTSKIVTTIIGRLIHENIGAAFFDPLVELHPANENDNGEMAAIAQIFRSIATTARCAVLLVHHTRKPGGGRSTGHAGNMDSARGGSSLVGVTRVGATLYTIDDKEAKQYGISKEEQPLYLRFDIGKNNMALAGGKPIFFKKDAVNIGTFEDPENVGVLKPVNLERRQRPEGEILKASLLDALGRLVKPTGSIAVPDLVRTLTKEDPVLFGENERHCTKKISAMAGRGEVPGFTFTPGRGRRPGRLERALCAEEDTSQNLGQTKVTH